MKEILYRLNQRRITMGDIKCPFCQQELESVLQLAGAGGLVEEAYLLCSKCNIRGERKLWQELARTRKALDVAKNGLKELKDIIACPPDVSYETGVSMYADGVLQEITALEQKDVK
jgi:hypothetical protein